MLLKLKDTKALVELLDVLDLINPCKDAVQAKKQAGEEEEQPEPHKKDNLIFPSGESLPRCWVDADYKDAKGS